MIIDFTKCESFSKSYPIIIVNINYSDDNNQSQNILLLININMQHKLATIST